MNDIVIDTNVLLHAENKAIHYCRSAFRTLELVLKADLCLCVDDVFSMDSFRNTSVIGHEYIQYIRTGTFAYAFLLDRLIKGKYKQIFKNEHKKIKLLLNKKVKNGEIHNRHDLAFVITAYGSQNKMLISNDYDDFNDRIREYILNSFLINILDSDEYVLLNQEPTHAQEKT
jgi:predicted nucleic acid-binding protein